jgi:hypothetical protein
MLEDFLKGNHFAMSLATLPWLWLTEGGLGWREGWITPKVSKLHGGIMQSRYE